MPSLAAAMGTARNGSSSAKRITKGRATPTDHTSLAGARCLDARARLILTWCPPRNIGLFGDHDECARWRARPGASQRAWNALTRLVLLSGFPRQWIF